ncbi:MAG: hypothetical protein K9M75_12625 [Phycisphaerae bacterium]|nr:hypothetical protein [Phycisphaerae bacterium]
MALKRVFIFVFAVFFLYLPVGQVEGIVLHPDNEPNLLTWSERPANDVVGRWGSNASCVAVAPNYVITTRHQGGGSSTAVTIGGTSYSISKIINHPTADLRVVELSDANLVEYASINYEADEQGQEIVLGGYGLGAGERVEIRYRREDYTFGYLWQGPETGPGNIELRWGTNQIEAVAETEPGYFTSDILVSQFDPPGATDYECSIAEHDSGGGWFLAGAGGWKVIGLSRGTFGFEPAMSVFMTEESPPQLFPKYPNGPMPNYMPADSEGNPIIYNYLDAVRISSYAEWVIEAICVNELRNLARNWLVDDCSETNNYCDNADKSRDGVVDLKDFAMLAGRWLKQAD